MRTHWLIAVALAGCLGSRHEDLGECSDGTQHCFGTDLEVCVDGHYQPSQECPLACNDTLGCVVCNPGATQCDETGAQICRNDGTGWDSFDCDPLQGLTCDLDTHTCNGTCLPSNLEQSNLGCNFFPTVTGNEVRSEFEFAVIISNDGNEPAQIDIEGGALATALTFTVAPRAVHVQRLPWVDLLKACKQTGVIECGNPQNSSALVQRGAYHLRSTQPITAYQYNPLDYGLPQIPCSSESHEGCSFSNDASLLLPAHTMTGNYYAAAWQNWYSRTSADFPGLITITATRDHTSVIVDATAPTTPAAGLPGMSPGQPQMISLDAGDVAQVFSRRISTESVDLTGTHITADKPIQVIGGHYCTETIGMACDHMEESILPVEVLGTTYIVTAPQAAPHSDFWGEVFTVGERYLRIVATEPDTTITYDPPNFRVAPGQTPPTYLTNAGDVGEVIYSYFRDSVQITANKKILVAEYMVGGQESNIGDPAMAVAVPAEQYRTDYSFHAPVNYDQNYVNIVARAGTQVMLDGNPVMDPFTPIGASGFGLARVLLDNTGSGTHHLQSNTPFGITVYGYGAFTSYWYPGGLDLRPIVIQ